MEVLRGGSAGRVRVPVHFLHRFLTLKWILGPLGENVNRVHILFYSKLAIANDCLRSCLY